MNLINKRIPCLSLYVLDRLTDLYPAFVPKIFQKLFLTFLGSKIFYNYYKVRYIVKLRRVKSFDNILVVPDINIGDAILMQKSVEVLRYYFPASRIDYICNRTAGELVRGIPGVNEVHSVFSGSGKPSKDDLKYLKEVIVRNKYTLILSLSPFLKNKDFQTDIPVLHIYIPFSAYVIRLWKLNARNLQLSFALHTFLQELLASSGIYGNDMKGAEYCPYIPFSGNTIYISHEAAESAKMFLKQRNIYPPKRLVYFNPNARSAFTQIPVPLQVRIVTNIIKKGDVNRVLISESDIEPRVEQLIIESLDAEYRKKVILVPRLQLSEYAALLDACDVFISGDTGPVHIASAWKIPLEQGISFRNRTCVVSVFGATDSRMYGYDSELPDHLPAKQNAPSRVFVAKNLCRNISCINKLGKTCSVIRCFDNLQAEEISNYVISYMKSLRYPTYIKTKRVLVRKTQ